MILRKNGSGTAGRAVCNGREHRFKRAPLHNGRFCFGREFVEYTEGMGKVVSTPPPAARKALDRFMEDRDEQSAFLPPVAAGSH